MPSTGSHPPSREIGKLHQGLATAADAQIAKVVAMVDALETRGAADAVIEPLRPRLAHLRPRRPLRFSRLLFMPLDPLIVPAAAWRPDDPTIPRTALAPFSGMVHAALGPEAQAIDEMIRGHTAEEGEIAAVAGARLWPAAAAVMAGASQPPVTWARTALPTEIGITLMHRIASLLAQAGTLQALFAEVEIGVSLLPAMLAPLVSAAATEGADILAMMVTLVLSRLPEARKPLLGASRVLGEQGTTQMRLALERAVEVMLSRLETTNGVEAQVIGSDLQHAGDEVRRIAQLLDRLQDGHVRPDEKSRLGVILQRLDACCRRRFGAAIELEFAAPLRRLGESSEPDAVSRLEDAARGLHDLKQEARRIGNPEMYDLLLQQAAALVKTAGPEHSLSLIDCARLVEILVGADEALTMLPDEPAPDASEEH